MPELPEVEGVVNSLKPVATGKTIKLVTISSVLETSRQAGKQAIIKGTELIHFKEALEDAKIIQIVRRSKYIYFYLEKDQQSILLVTHLGMTGAWFYVHETHEISEEKYRKHIHVIFKLNDDMLLVYTDIRRFGEMRLLQSEEQFPPLLLMAPEPFDEPALNNFLDMANLPKYQNKSIKETIMDGQVISGCGNIYATEALYNMHIHPARKVKRISQKRLIALFHKVVDVLNESILAGGSSISDYRNINGEAGGMQDRLQMYGKKQCPVCSIPTKQLVLGGRNSWYCPSCQK
ncbi:bifunctional DNA-formamidopyrimidine glycosylase/DNA-(apurinic or apyrimidinic site) lyase [Paenisporosarcina sp. TG20]|uniref:bifunctional DNA-formamidopyrimidine glycosylase/DNA-(apurinic or apyrimidinic site) lyase n=1 Tax=Paenisporosarcina sp. TG20 TaxID=1211706 RepID=UPI0002E4B685|nr:bifunctional DNA-formamidopyrimidine glycosylase/DNA-(apurinic or apyrimidinic site) lyase [Paenisporosarcina sp. TG20]